MAQVVRNLLTLLVILLLSGMGVTACDDETTEQPDVGDVGLDGNSDLEYSYSVPLDPESPWPKFRRNAMQNGRSPVMPIDTGRDLWVFPTGKGIFSTPVIDGDGTVYIGSANQTFYAIDVEGNMLWSYLTGEIIDSSALLDDEGRVIFGSGDGHLYALDRDDGTLLWNFKAHEPSVNGAFINWFEGNVAMGLDGTLYVPNDNFCTYAIDREDGSHDWCFLTQDQTWSLPALNPETNRLFIGNNFFFLQNIFAIDPTDGSEIWSAVAQGSVAASPMLASTDANGLVVVGGYDGIVRALSQDDGAEQWTFGTRDHIYASPGQMADGTIIQPSADGTVYALHPSDGSVVWAFDTREPLRSSPAIDGAGNIYVGSGEGRLFVINPDGTLRWSIRLIDDLRDDLNASPALGEEMIVIAGESGDIFGVPFDYCLRDAAASDERCTVGVGEALEDDGVYLVYTTHFGGLLVDPPATVLANQPLAFSLFVREAGDTTLALVDSESVSVTLTPDIEARVDVSGDRKFITVVPSTFYTDRAGGELTVRIEGDYLINLERNGLAFYGGEVGGSFDQTFTFEVAPRSEMAFPFAVPAEPGDDSGILDLFRLAAPLPTILPSYNQIGFDSIHYVVGVVEGDDSEMVAWAVGGMLSGEDDTVLNPASDVRFPLEIQFDDGLITLINEEGFTVEFNGFPLPFDFFRVSTEIDDSGEWRVSPMINAIAVCGEIDFYGSFLQLLGFCNPDTDLLDVFGGSDLRPHGTGTQSAPTGVGPVVFTRDATSVTATLTGTALKLEDHNYGLLLVGTTTGRALPLDYTSGTTHAADAAGIIKSVTLEVGDGADVEVRAYLMVDAYPAAVETIAAP